MRALSSFPHIQYILIEEECPGPHYFYVGRVIKLEYLWKNQENISFEMFEEEKNTIKVLF